MMARKQARPEASQEVVLEPIQITCRACGNRMRMARHSQRMVTTLQGVTHLTLKVYRCSNADCPRFRQVTRPEEEGQWAITTWRICAGCHCSGRGAALSGVA
ncbi:hypothetical protein [Ktedonobacter racemifer]|uniref:hypothetical protein n=1 Tax=Ktedonobacter racemifer TaxID=363277 RepID=UPI0012F91E13|nr:hypothetical protein [Ktedonobacter racemifer]